MIIKWRANFKENPTRWDGYIHTMTKKVLTIHETLHLTPKFMLSNYLNREESDKMFETVGEAQSEAEILVQNFIKELKEK
jgi:hypothetical protein